MATPPSPEWGREKLPRLEMVWLLASVVLVVIVFSAWMLLWHVFGYQNSVGEVYRVHPLDFAARAEEFTMKYKVGEEHGFAVVRPPPGGDVYITASQFTFTPEVIVLKAGVEYRLHISSVDVQHGFSILNPFQWVLQIYPGYEYILKFVPTKPGTYYIVCNEYCGPLHHKMVAKVVVEA